MLSNQSVSDSVTESVRERSPVAKACDSPPAPAPAPDRREDLEATETVEVPVLSGGALQKARGDWLSNLPSCASVLRDYQRAQIECSRVALSRGVRRILQQAPTGAGKTHMIAATVAAAVSNGLRVLILATRTRLVRQLHERLEAFGVVHGVVAAPLPQLMHFMAPAQVASVDTLYRRCMVDERAPLPLADLVIFDEAHLATGDSRVKLLREYPSATLIGFSATPAKVSGRSLGSLFDELIVGPSMQQLIASGSLVRPRIFSAPAIRQDELDGVTVSQTGDYAVGELSEVMRRPRIVGDVIATWLRCAAGKRTLVFACDKAHGQSIVEDFLRQGVAAELLTDNDDDAAREAAIARLERGETLVIVNCFLLSYGVDMPTVECISLARPTRSLVLYLQSVGRGMRPAPGKDSVIVLDHGRIVERLGLPTDDFGWTLNTRDNANARAALAAKRKVGEEKPRTCAECACVWSVQEQGSACPNCGWQHVTEARRVVVEHGDLVEIDGPAEHASDAAHEQFFAEALGWYAQRWPDRWRAKPNGGRWWAWLQVCERFGLAGGHGSMRPEFWRVAPSQASYAVGGWLKSRLIAFAKSHSHGGPRAVA